MPHSSTVSFLSYWRGLQASPEKAPARELFDPARLKSLVPQMMMISGTDAGHRFRLSGGFLRALHGYELKDTSFLSLFRPPFVDTIGAALALGRRREQPVLLTLTAPWKTDAPELPPEDADLFQNETVTFEILLCPMMNRYGKVDRMVGLYQTLSAAPKNPKGWLGRYTLISSKLYEPDRNVKAAHLRLVSDGGRRIA
ncbi:PAS domain-containing protein [Asticcacaulis sp. 201]|uniref:PAS domain-containing protein n=1 Tax=Asticcacaulis sp. 201 TaxID=3028787 RepID=UPI0029170F13|nr:PAS domain-containing protein [Asticcacaulis sp. 201]MDV6332969.1 PAS domain-containing protein [Asticcacaulis sp. 201]